MPSWIVPSDTHIVGDANHTPDHNHIADDLTLINNAAPVVSGGLTGAVAATRFAGGTASGSPGSGTFAVGDFVIDQTGKVWICTAAGTPGTWANAGTGSGMSNPMTTLGDIIFENSTPVPARLAGNTSATKNFLTQTGTGAVSAAPAWGTIAAGDVPVLNQNTTGSSASCTGNAATATNLAGGATLPAYLAPKVVTLTFVAAGTTLVDASLGNAFALTLTASTTTLGNPSNSVDGEVIRVRLIQDATGGRTISYGANYDFGAGSAPTLSAGASKVDILGFEYVASLSKWAYLGSGLGF